MDLRCLLLCVFFVSLFLCDRSLTRPTLPLQTAALETEVPLYSVADPVQRGGSSGQAAEEKETKVYSKWRAKMTQPEDLMQNGHSRSSHEEPHGDAPSSQRLLQEAKNSSAIKAQAEKHGNDDTTIIDRKKGSSDKKASNAVSHANTPTNGKTGSTEKKAQSTEVPAPPPPPPPPPSIKPDIEPVTERHDDKVNNKTLDVRKGDPETKEDGTYTGQEHSSSAIQCGESHCEDSNKLVSACLRTQGAGAQMFSLSITYKGNSRVTVKVLAPEFLIADRLEVLVRKGRPETIQFMMNSKFEASALDFEAVKNTTITVTMAHGGECQIAVPIEYLHNFAQEKNLQHSSYSSFNTPIASAYVLLFVFVMTSAGAWLCYKCCGRKRSGDAMKYQQLEMNASGLGTQKERTDAWEGIWDDDWEDAEAAKSSSCLSQNLSSRGLVARRGTKDGWDNSWED